MLTLPAKSISKTILIKCCGGGLVSCEFVVVRGKEEGAITVSASCTRLAQGFGVLPAPGPLPPRVRT